MDSKSTEETINARRSLCDNCDAPGVHVDTSAGEIVGQGGVVVAVVLPRDEVLLMVDGELSQRLVCEDCE